MNVPDIIVLAVLGIVIVIAVFGIVRNKKKGCGCCGNCTSCGLSANCKDKK